MSVDLLVRKHPKYYSHEYNNNTTYELHSVNPFYTMRQLQPLRHLDLELFRNLTHPCHADDFGLAQTSHHLTLVFYQNL